jgi:eukaryotic-like serine/threonine-protein kinase
MGRSVSLTVVLSLLVTASTYIAMHFLVEPRLPVHAVDVPSLSGLSPEQARGLLEPKGLLLILDEERPDERAAPGTLIDQRPLAGSRLRRGEDVHAAVAKAVKVPKLVGLTGDAARDALAEAKLKPGTLGDVPSATAPKGQVVAQNPAPGADARSDGTVDLQLSSGPASQPVPSVIGKSKSTAKALLEKAGFVVGNLHVGSNDDYDSGIVIRQDPSANSQAAPGSKIDLTIND